MKRGSCCDPLATPMAPKIKLLECEPMGTDTTSDTPVGANTTMKVRKSFIASRKHDCYKMVLKWDHKTKQQYAKSTILLTFLTFNLIEK